MAGWPRHAARPRRPLFPIDFEAGWFENYHLLVRRVDARCGDIERRFRRWLACRPGCDHCCEPVSVAAVEAANLVRVLRLRAEETRRMVTARPRQTAGRGGCPLLAGGRCSLYAARPLVCRTHGYPLRYIDQGRERLTCCPLNFQAVAQLPLAAAVDMERVNLTLAAVNRLFIEQSALPVTADQRFTLDRLLREALDEPGEERA